jgi:hypothetical protein
MDGFGLLHDYIQQDPVQHDELCVSVLFDVLALRICINRDASLIANDQPVARGERRQGHRHGVADQAPALVVVFRVGAGQRQHSLQVLVGGLHPDDQEHDAGDDADDRLRHRQGAGVHPAAGHRAAHQLGSGHCVRGRDALLADRLWAPALCHVF